MTETPPEQQPTSSAVGPLAQEAAMLLDVVAERLEQLKSPPAAAAPAATPPAAAAPAATPPAAAAPAATPPAATPAAATPAADARTGGETDPTTPADEQGARNRPSSAGGQGRITPDDEQRARDGQASAGAPSTADGRCPECGSVPGAYCTACPLCRLMALLRGERPEATARLVDGALMIIRTLRSLIPEPGESAAAAQHHAHGPAHSAPTPAHPHAPPAARRTGLEHINIQ